MHWSRQSLQGTLQRFSLPRCVKIEKGDPFPPPFALLMLRRDSGFAAQLGESGWSGIGLNQPAPNQPVQDWLGAGEPLEHRCPRGGSGEPAYDFAHLWRLPISLLRFGN